MRINIAVFASGGGSNAEKIFSYFQDHPQIRVKLLITNNKKAGVIQRAKQFEIPVVVINKIEFFQTEKLLGILDMQQITFIALAGFLWKIPEYLLQSFDQRIVNIHPSLLPKYGGKGMYGKYVHEAVLQNAESESGITIHLVNQDYDRGEILIQDRCRVIPGDTPETLASRVLELEHKHFAKVIEWYIQKRLNFS